MFRFRFSAGSPIQAFFAWVGLLVGQVWPALRIEITNVFGKGATSVVPPTRRLDPGPAEEQDFGWRSASSAAIKPGNPTQAPQGTNNACPKLLSRSDADDNSARDEMQFMP
jgi:hypothetical protein